MAGRTGILPEGVRQALQHESAELGAEEVSMLIADCPGLCLYGTSKLLDAAGKLDRLPSLLRAHLWLSAGQFSDMTEQALSEVDGTKVAMPRLSEHARKLPSMSGIYRRAALAHSGELVYLMAHSTLVGVDSFAKAREDMFGILFGSANEEAPWRTLIVDPEEMVITALRATGSPEGVVLDDIVRTGATHQAVRDALPNVSFVALQ